jgi:hypothetical protein
VKVGEISENPVLVGSDYKRACLFFDEIIPIVWPSPESKDQETEIAQYVEYRNALEAPVVKQALVKSRWNDWISAYGYLAIGRFVFQKINRDCPELTDPSQVATATLNFLKSGKLTLDQKFLSICFPDVATLAKRVAYDPLAEVVASLEHDKVAVDTYGHTGLVDTDDSVDVMLSNIDLVQCGNLTWEHIGEVRKDPKAVSELRTLRRFLLDEMKGYTKSHVEDVLGQAIQDHKRAATKWGIGTLPSSIKVDCEGSIVAGILTAIGVMVTGVPLATAAAIGAIAPLAQGLISIHKGRKSVILNSKVQYLVRLEKAATAE